jgi:hypothetical protein
MSIKAIAFHESFAIAKLHKYFASAESLEQSDTKDGTCYRCNLAFAIVLVAKSDPRNTEYIGHLKSIIADDCVGGLHQDEYILREPEEGGIRGTN